MGRRRLTPYNVQEKNKKSYLSSEAIKNRHRNADSKYRQTVQKLYDLLRKAINETAAKDNLLNTVLDYMQSMEKEIFDTIGPADYLEYKQRFMTLLCYEEAEWKQEKDLCKWWSNMQEFLKKKIQAPETSLQDDAKNYALPNSKLDKLEMSSDTLHVSSETCSNTIFIPSKQNNSSEKDKDNSLLSHCNDSEISNCILKSNLAAHSETGFETFQTCFDMPGYENDGNYLKSIDSSPYETSFPMKLGMESLATECAGFGEEHLVALEIPVASPISKLMESEFADNNKLQSSSTLLFL